MVEPVYLDEAVALYQGHCVDVLKALAKRDPPITAAAVLTDPPFSAHVHTNARKDAGGRKWRSAGGEGDVPSRIDPTPLLDFPPWTMRDMGRMLLAIQPFKPKWCVLHLDWRHGAELERSPKHRPGWTFIRLGIWVKVNGTPQFTGDRPGQGWEAIAFLHNPGRGALAWNGGGDSSVFTGMPQRPAVWASEKPAWLARRLVELFTDPGDLIIDTCAGSGTFLRAAKDLGRRAIGVELDPRAIPIAIEKLTPAAHPRLPLEEPVTEQISLGELAAHASTRPQPREKEQPE